MAGKMSDFVFTKQASFVNEPEEDGRQVQYLGNQKWLFAVYRIDDGQKVTAIVWFIVSYGVFCEGCESKKCKTAVRTRARGLWII